MVAKVYSGSGSLSSILFEQVIKKPEFLFSDTKQKIRGIAICCAPLFAWRCVSLTNTEQVRDSKQKC